MYYAYDELGNLVEDRDAEIDTILWSLSGKIRFIDRISGSTKENIGST